MNAGLGVSGRLKSKGLRDDLVEDGLYNLRQGTFKDVAHQYVFKVSPFPSHGHVYGSRPVIYNFSKRHSEHPPDVDAVMRLTLYELLPESMHGYIQTTPKFGSSVS